MNNEVGVPSKPQDTAQDVKHILEALQGMLEAFCSSEAGEIDRKLAVLDAQTVIRKYNKESQ